MALFETSDWCPIDKGYVPIGGGTGWLRILTGVKQPDYSDQLPDIERADDFKIVPIHVTCCQRSPQDMRRNKKSIVGGEIPLIFEGLIELPDDEQFDSNCIYAEKVVGYFFPSGYRRGSIEPYDK